MRHALVAAGVGRGGGAGKPAAAGSEQGGDRLQQPQGSVQPHQQQPSHFCQLHGPNSTHETSECRKLRNEFLAHYNEFCAYMSGRREAQGSIFPRGGAQGSGRMVRAGVGATLQRCRDRRVGQDPELEDNCRGATLGGVGMVDTALAPRKAEVVRWAAVVVIVRRPTFLPRRLPTYRGTIFRLISPSEVENRRAATSPRDVRPRQRPDLHTAGSNHLLRQATGTGSRLTEWTMAEVPTAAPPAGDTVSTNCPTAEGSTSSKK
ncbi:unnamed protein product [Ectocarpus sp. CCAP 1310/34]|nr:unnamed protein product [Ectocarpus sp. CCAP 1310/34]